MSKNREDNKKYLYIFFIVKYIMKSTLGCLLVIALLLLIVFNTVNVESFGGHGGGRHGGGRHGGGRHGGGRHGGGRHGGGRHGGGRRWWGGGHGYGYGTRPMPYYRWYNPWNWYNRCKDGCSSIGNGRWGCQYPGNGPNSCIFAADCYGCG